jgi:hypothetical protein
MNDTTKDIEKLYNQKLMAMSSDERIFMADSMFESARQIVLSSFPDNFSEKDIKFNLFLRFYKNDYTQEQIEKIKDWFYK